MNTFNLIIGAGAVGKALKEVFTECILIDKNPTDFTGKVNYMHIAFPYGEDFVNEVVRYIKKYKPKITIIHSTVKLGVSREIRDKTNSSIVYSPVIGQHNDLIRSLKTFYKCLAGFSKKDTEEVNEYFKNSNLKILDEFENPETLELAKLLATTRYALSIAFAQEQERICKRYGADYRKVVSEFEAIFNIGCEALEQNYLIRPLVKPDIIGGHCLLPNLKILKLMYKSDFFKLVEESNERKRKEK